MTNLTMKTLLLAGLVALAGLLPIDSLQAQAVERIGSFRDWTTFRTTGGQGSFCFIGSQPTKSQGNYTRRGRVFLSVANRGAYGSEISFQAGYPYDERLSIKMEVDGVIFSAFGKGESAWLRSSAKEPEMIKAMKKGVVLIIKGTSKRGTLTTDTFSLRGFTAAFNAMRRNCN